MTTRTYTALSGSGSSRASAGRTVAVTGGAGFLGSHLCEALLARGDNVVCIDNFHTGTPANVRRLVASNRFEILEHDVVEELPSGLPAFDEIWNLACPASPVHYQDDPVRTLLTCADGARRVVERALHDGAKIFHASTSEIYGDPEIHPQPEVYYGNVNTVGPRSCYDEGKRYAETLLTDFCGRAGLTLKMARIFNTYGPRMQADDGRVVSNFVIQALRGEDITVYGRGEQTRSFCYVDDLISGFLRLMASGSEVRGPVNLGNPVETPVGELAELVIEMTNSPSRIVSRPLPVDDPRRRRPDISRARNLLGWEPRVALRDGLQRTIAHFDALLSAERAASTLPFALAASARTRAEGRAL